MTDNPANPLVSSHKSSQLSAVLHPLVLLTISDYITRHTLRQQKGPIIGALLGQQNGREITIEHAFECHLREAPEVDGAYLLDATKFSERLEQMVLVHKDRNLELVGWYTLLPSSGPTPANLPIHNQFLADYNESSIVLGFHPEEILYHTVGGTLPLTIYESNYEVDDPKAGQDGEDKAMDDGEPTLHLRFQELSYSVETDETEMISMNYVASGSGSAAAAVAVATKEEKTSRSIESNGKGKRRLVESPREESKEPSQDDAGVLTRAEEEMIASLTTKANAIKMLHSRVHLLTTYMERLPPSFINGETSETGVDSDMDTEFTTPSLTILRQIQALVSRLDLVIPSDQKGFETELLQESNDVDVITLLNSLMQSVGQAREVGKKFSIIESANKSNRRHNTAERLGGASTYTQSGAAEI